MTSDKVKDGFDLIDYPCDYAFKAMCRVDKSSVQSSVAMIEELVMLHLPQAALLETSSKKSRTGKFESVTITVRLTGREQLDAIYRGLSASAKVVMTL